VKLFTLKDLIIRSKPKWSSPAITHVKVNTELTFKEFDETKHWI